jgi:hypothetical protein
VGRGWPGPQRGLRDIRPTLYLVHVLPFLDPKMLVEIELVAQKSAG